MGQPASCCCNASQESLDGEDSLLNYDQCRGRTTAERLVSVVAALRAGKLPSQFQIDAIAKAFIDVSPSPVPVELQRGTPRYGAEKVVYDFKCFVQTLLVFGDEKNSDDLIQEILHAIIRFKAPPLNVRNRDCNPPTGVLVDIGELPDDFSPEALRTDISSFIVSLQTLLLLFVSSRPVRTLVTNVACVVREAIREDVEVVVDIAKDVEDIAKGVEAIAKNVEEVAGWVDKVADGSLVEETDQHDTAKSTKTPEGTISPNSEDPKQGPENETKDVILQVLEDLLREAHQSGRVRLLKPLLVLLRKYCRFWHTTGESVTLQTFLSPGGRELEGTPDPFNRPESIDPDLRSLLGNVKLFAERLAGGKSFNGVVQAFVSVVRNVVDGPPDERILLADMGVWLEKALDEKGWASSRNGRRGADLLYDRAKKVLNTESALTKDVRKLAVEADIFMNAIKDDGSTTRLLESFTAVKSSVTGFFVRGDAGRLKDEAIGYLVSWALQALGKLSAKIGLPMPRLELKTPNYEAVLDALLVGGKSALTPDTVRVTSWSDVQIGIAKGSENETKARARVRVSVLGMRAALENVVYYAKYGLGWLGYEDEGLVSVILGGDGISVDMELETRSSDGDGRDSERLFEVRDVNVSCRGMQITVDRSKHYILNKVFVQPVLSGVVVRKAIETVMAGWIRDCAEGVERFLRRVATTAREKGDGEKASAVDYCEAAFEVIGESTSQSEEPPTSSEQHIERHVQATATGVVITTTAEHDSSASSATFQDTPDMELAIGIAPNILPGKGQLEDVTGRLEELEDLAIESVRHAQDFTQDFTQELGGVSGNDLGAMTEIEASSGGWRSMSFQVDGLIHSR